MLETELRLREVAGRMKHTHCSGEEMVTHKLGKYPRANTHDAEPAEDEHS
jgi:hypothetical protein